MNTLIIMSAITLASIIVIPLVVFLSIKVGTMGYLLGCKRFRELNTNGESNGIQREREKEKSCCKCKEEGR